MTSATSIEGIEAWIDSSQDTSVGLKLRVRVAKPCACICGAGVGGQPVTVYVLGPRFQLIQDFGASRNDFFRIHVRSF